MAQDSKNILGFTQQEWNNLSKKQKKQANWKLFKQNVIPALLGGSLGASLFAKDPSFRKLGIAITAVAVTGATTGFDPTDFKNSWQKLKDSGANLLDLKKPLTKDQTVGLSILGEQDAVKSTFSVIGEGKAVIKTDTGESYGLDFENPTQLTGVMLAAKGVPKATADKVTALVAKQPINKVTKIPAWLQKLWKGVYTNLPAIIESMKSDGLTVPSDFNANDGWDGTSVLNDKLGEPDQTAPTPATTGSTILGFKTENVILTVGGAGIAYAIFKQ